VLSILQIFGGPKAMFGLGTWEILVVALVIVLLFGTKRLPELGSGLGKAISNFRKAYKDGNAIDVTPPEEGDKKDPQGK
jgi:sec-independent protein translocase protein TatA